MSHKIYFALLLLCWPIATAWGQPERFIGLQARYGRLFKGDGVLDPGLERLPYRGLGLVYHRQTDGSKDWHERWGFPETGMSLTWFHQGNNREFGQLFYTTFYLQKKIFPTGSTHNLSFRMAPGFAISTQWYDPQDNPRNVLVSQPFTFVMEGNLQYEWRVSPHWRLESGVLFSHWSNGAMKRPNRGGNVPSLFIGTSFVPRPAAFQPKRSADALANLDKSITFHTALSASVVSPTETQPDQVFAWAVSHYANKRINLKSGLTLGADFMYSNAIPIASNQPDATRYRIGATIGHELYVSRVSLLTQVGYYVYRPVKIDKAYYFRWGIKHYFSDQFFGSFLLKTHLGRAELLEWGIGYVFAASKRTQQPGQL